MKKTRTTKDTLVMLGTELVKQELPTMTPKVMEETLRTFRRRYPLDPMKNIKQFVAFAKIIENEKCGWLTKK